MGLNLITLDDYKVFEGINSSVDDEKLEALLASVSQLVKTYCRQDFVDSVASPGVTDIFDVQWATHVVQLRKFPIITVLNVYERSAQNESYTELFSNGTNDKYEWYFDSITDSIFRTNSDGNYLNWPCGVGAVKVTYTAGYNSLPEDLKLAIVDLITYYSKDEHKLRQSIASAVRENQGTSSIGVGFPDHIKRVLDLYKAL